MTRPLGPINGKGIIVMPEPTSPNAVPPTPPDLRWPLAAIGWCSFWLTLWLLNVVLSPSVGGVIFAVISGGTVGASARWHQRRVAERDEWRRARYRAWLFKPPMPAPELTDWDEYERDLNPDW